MLTKLSFVGHYSSVTGFERSLITIFRLFLSHFRFKIRLTYLIADRRCVEYFHQTISTENYPQLSVNDVGHYTNATNNPICLYEPQGAAFNKQQSFMPAFPSIFVCCLDLEYINPVYVTSRLSSPHRQHTLSHPFQPNCVRAQIKTLIKDKHLLNRQWGRGGGGATLRNGAWHLKAV